MKKAELLAKIKAEIEKRKSKAEAERVLYPKTILSAKNFLLINDYVELLSFISTLESEKPVPNDLQEYASRAGFDYVDDIEAEDPGHRWNDHDVEFAYRDGIIAGAKWQAEQLDNLEQRWDELQTNFREINEAFEAGKKEQKEQMMKEAVEGEYGYFSNASKTILPSRKLNLKEGDRVRVIILTKEDEK